MSLVTQLIYNIMGEGLSFFKKCLDKETKKNIKETALTQDREKSLVPQETKEVKTQPITGCGGFVNLALILGTVSILKLILGLFVSIADETIPIVNLVPRMSLLPLSLFLYPVFAMLLTLRIEILLFKNKLRLKYARCFHVTTLMTCLALPVVTLRRKNNLDLLIENLFVCLFFIILAMKLISFIQVNERLREMHKRDELNVNSAGNLSLGDFTRFWLSPELVYRPEEYCYSSIRIELVLQRLMEVCVIQVVVRQGMLIIRCIVHGLLKAAEKEDLLVVIERFLTLSLAFNIVWMLSFYLVFVSFLQLMAEMSQTRERLFFLSWWNASTMDEFWRWWNKPVHRWCVKHIYVPFVKSKYSKISAMLAVFVTSAVFHEYLISCPLQITGHFALLGMLGQMPLIKISEVVKRRYGGRAGNLLVWSVLIFGNTSGVVTYYREVLDDA